jgi:hypothetical protein
MTERITSPEVARSESRLTPLDRNRELRPWQRAAQLTRCFLYWMPVNGFPIPADQRLWILQFFSRLSDLLTKKHQLRAEVFVKFKVIYPGLLNTFLKNSREYHPMLGLGRKPGAQLPAIPTVEDLQPLIEGREKFDFGKYTGDYCYWFVNKFEKRQREDFFGHGATLTLFLKPDPATVAPKLPFTPELRKKSEVLRRFDPDPLIAKAFALKDGFLSQSKQLFGVGLEHEPQYKGLLFVLPLLGTQDFFGQPAEEAEKWFQVFDVYINESPTDNGIVMAFKSDIEEDLVALLQEIRDEGFNYPGR